MKAIRLFTPLLLAVFFLALLFNFMHQDALARGRGDANPFPPHLEPAPRDVSSERASILNSNSTFGLSVPAVASSNIISNVLSAGDDQVHGLIYYDGNLWATTRTSPARILKIDPTTLEVLDSQELSGDDGEDIEAAQGYVWVILYTEPAKLVRIDPINFSSTTFTITQNGHSLNRGASLKFAFGYLWAGGRDALARIDISNPDAPTYQVYNFSDLNKYTVGVFGSLASSQDSLWGMYLQYLDSPPGAFLDTTMVKIDPGNPAATNPYVDVASLFPDDMVYLDNHLYSSSENFPRSTTPSDIYRFANDLNIDISRAYGSASYGTFLDPLDLQGFWGVYVSSPGQIKRFDLEANGVLTLTLPDGFIDPSEMAFDEGGDLYVSTWQSPARLVKFPSQFFRPDLTIQKTASPETVVAGERVTYTLVITNSGPVPASDVIVTDTLPSQISFLSSLPDSINCVETSGMLTCGLGALAAHSSIQVQIVGRVDASASGVLTNQARVSSTTEAESDYANNLATADTPIVRKADLEINKVDEPDPVAFGENVTYTLTIKNNGPSDDSGVIVTDTLPSQMTFISASPAPDDVSGPIVWELGSLAALENRNITLVARVDASAGSVLNNRAIVSGAEIDVKPENNSASTNTTVSTVADLAITKSAQPDQVAIGDLITYTLLVTNNGPSEANEVIISDTLSTSVDFLSFIPDMLACSELNQIVTCDLGNLPAGHSLPVEIIARVNKNAKDSIYNSATVTALNRDQNWTNNTSTVETEFIHRTFLPLIR